MCGLRRIKSWFLRTRPASQAPDGPERESPRVPAELFVSPPNTSAVLEVPGNVGLGGFCFVSEGLLLPGTRLDLMIDLHELDRWFIVQGEVLGSYERDGQTFVRGRFLEVDFEDERWLARWLDGRCLEAA
ncbi:MAG TPA: PilZ domain-containing protein [Myxococcota bacterium]|nr:PilZ domain-containing protein [Myxococcota bacterium]HRY93788.1 PilZ domain-containing protein [Myxococcota bacterium]HSA20470.1 PilZ domain-containing protein [Myxococcota bacterium]